MCHIENVVRSTVQNHFSFSFFLLFFSTLCLLFVGNISEGFVGGIRNPKRYMIFLLFSMPHDITIFNCIFCREMCK